MTPPGRELSEVTVFQSCSQPCASGDATAATPRNDAPLCMSYELVMGMPAYNPSYSRKGIRNSTDLRSGTPQREMISCYISNSKPSRKSLGSDIYFCFVS